MRKIALILWMFILFMDSYASMGQKAHVRFNHFTTENGLSSNLIFAMDQDSSGFLWLGTDFGLDRFDGKLFKHFRKDKYPDMHREDLYYVKCMDGGVYVGSFSGTFQKYDSKTDGFTDLMPTELDSLGYSQIKGVQCASDGTRYLFTNERVFRYDAQRKCFNSKFQAFDSLRSPFISSLHIDSGNRIWIGSINQLSIYDTNGHALKIFNEEHDHCGFVSGIVPMEKNRWIVTFLSNRVWIVEYQDEAFRIREEIRLPFNSVNKITRGKNGRYWFATDGDGLWFADSITVSTTFTEVVPTNAPTDGLRKIYSIIESEDGTIWLGTQNSGLWSLNMDDHSTILYSKDYGFPHSACTSFTEDGHGNILVGSDGNGVYSVSPDFREIKQYHLSCDNVLGVNSTHEGIYVSTWGGGLYALSPSGTSTPVSHDPDFNPTKIFFHVCETSDSTIWACSANDDPYIKRNNEPWRRMSLKDEENPSLESKWTTRVMNASGKSCWIISTNLLWLFDGTTPHVVHPEIYASKSHNPFVVVDADRDEEGNLYVLSNHGILRFSADNLAMDTLSFMPKDSYRIIRRDDNGNFWVASANGIFSFDYQHKTYSRLPGNYPDLFYYKSSYKDSNGRLYFGTAEGFYSFDPKNIAPDTLIQHLSFAELYVSKEKINGDNPLLKGGDLSDLKGLELKYGMTDVDLHVDLVDHSYREKATLRYRLKGLTDTWTPVGEKRVISFNFIPTGHYTLEVEAFRSNIGKPLKHIELEINVLPPWWNTWWFRTILLLIAGSLLFIPLHKKIIQLKKEKALLKDEIDEQTALLEKTRRERQKLIHALTHDLHNPLFAVVGESPSITEETTTEEIVELVIDKALLDDNLLLLIGMDPETKKGIKEMLSNYIHMKEAANWEEAVESIEMLAPDIIVCDMGNSMGGEMNRLLSSDSLKHIPILFVSDKNEETDRLLGLIYGAVDFMAKPFNQLELLLKLTNILKIKQEQQKVILQRTMTNKVKNAMDNTQQEETIHPFLQAFVDVVRSKYQDSETSPDSLASALMVSKPTMNRKIKALTGKTPMEWVTEYRLNKALQLLQDHNDGKNISEIAYEVGFSDPSYFSKKFKDQFGILPSQVN
ncbi:MAG: helix-turn-helix domain-containing protein [Paludibacteraceae bacterium]|nr:helix-turn-helix domain-containing protein [Paludibacteraceae bacterium]MBP5480348.1 helix-turn-helix domain-containing protein [Paludibacteraceae bacterium]